MAEPGAGVLPEAYRPAASPDVPDGQSCANCVFFETQDEGEDWCNWWEAPVEADAYCDAWSDDPAAMTEIVDEGLEEVDEVPMNVNKRASFETVDEDESRYMDQAADKAAGGPKWEGVIAVEDQMTGDSRMFSPGAMRWDTLPVPLRWVKEDTGEHFGAVVVGRVDEVWRDGNVIYGRGIFDEGSEEGKEAIRQVTEGFTQGVSVDLDDVSFEIRVRGEVADPMADPATEDQPAEPTDPNTVMNFTPDEEVMVTTDARLRALTLVATPAFAEARIQMTGDMTPAAEPTEDEVPDELIAAAAPTLPPSGWFIDPKLDGPTPLTITADGRVYGHLAVWGTCHTGFVGECVEPPASATNYAYFRTGAVRTSDKETVATGRLTVDTTHAGRRLGAADTSAHYEHTGLAVADVAAGEDIHGIWVAGALRPNVTDEQVRALQASPLSGDWRRIGGNLELVAALAVNSPGFPVPRVLVAGGKVQTLQASGVLTAEEPADVETETKQDAAQLDFDTVVKRLIEREARLMERERKQAAAAKNRLAASLARARYAMATGKFHGDHEQSSHAWGGGPGGATQRTGAAEQNAEQIREEVQEARDAGLIDAVTHEQLIGDVQEAEARIRDAATTIEDYEDIMADAEATGDDEMAGEAAEMIDDAHRGLAEAEEYLESAESELQAAIDEAEAESADAPDGGSAAAVSDRASSVSNAVDLAREQARTIADPETRAEVASQLAEAESLANGAESTAAEAQAAYEAGNDADGDALLAEANADLSEAEQIVESVSEGIENAAAEEAAERGR